MDTAAIGLYNLGKCYNQSGKTRSVIVMGVTYHASIWRLRDLEFSQHLAGGSRQLKPVSLVVAIMDYIEAPALLTNSKLIF
ncbi:hypothetical protein GAMM_220010 [Gammaproteobacteria bacterium]